MLRLIGLVVSIGLADSLNPTTIAPAMLLATGDRPRRRVLEFTIGVFVVYLAGGALIALGPGSLLLSLIPKPDANARHIIEIVVGVAMLIASALVWRSRARLAERDLPEGPQGKSSALLGATITAIELPTAFPYFAAIAAIVGSDLDPARVVLLLVLFNLCFVLPLIVMVITLWLAGDRAAAILTSIRDYLQRRWPVIVSMLLLLAGIFVILLGATALGSSRHGRLGRIFRRVNHIIHP